MGAANLWIAWVCVAAAFAVCSGALPKALAEAESVLMSDKVRAQLRTFFGKNGPGSRFRIALELGCVEGEGRLGTPSTRQWRRPANLDLYDSKWGLESSLPLMVQRSPWYAESPAVANASLVVFRPRAHARSDLSRCRRVVDPGGSRSDLWFVASTDRGRCCDGGQLRDPSLLAHHFLVVSGERARGEWLFREHGATKHAWRAPPSRDTAPRVRCFDNAMDVALPPPAFVRKEGDDRAFLAIDARARNATRPFLAMHAEGGVSPPEYDLRRALSKAYAPDWWENLGKDLPDAAFFHIRKKMDRKVHADALFTAKFCLVVEGFAPWTPRLAEAIKAGCVPAFLSPALRPPFADVLDWSKFSVVLDRGDVRRLRSVLEARDHADLHANLLKVRSLFAFHVDAPRKAAFGDAWGPPDALPLAVFEMWRRFRARKAGGPQFERRSAADPGALAVLAAADEPPSTPHAEARAVRTDVSFSCAADAESCVYALHGVTWNCSTRSPMACGCVRVPGP